MTQDDQLDAVISAASKPPAVARSAADLAAATRVLHAMREHDERLPKRGG